MRRLSYILLLVLVATDGWSRDSTDFNGHYLWTSNAVETAALAKEVDDTVATLLFLLRPIARPRLTQSMAPYASLDITLGASNTIQFARTGASVIRGQLGGTVKWEREEGVLQDVAFALTADGKLQQTFSESDGTRVQLFTLAPNGTNLTMDVAINSKRLDRPIKYTLTYVKQPVVK